MNWTFKTKNFENPDEFIRALRRSEAVWCDNNNSEYCMWYFRGQQDAEWHLVPSGFREHPMPLLIKVYLDEADKWVNKHNINWMQWIGDHIQRPDGLDNTAWESRVSYAGRLAFAQMLSAREFIFVADYANYPLKTPEELYLVGAKDKSYLAQYISGHLLSNSSILIPCIALAQHHGIPTSFLDWTYNPLVAAFFAAESACQHNSIHGSKFAVFAIHRKVVESDKYISRITLPPGTVPFLDAQEGLFLWCRNYLTAYLATGVLPHFDSLLEDTAKGVIDIDAEPLLMKYTLPVEYALEVLRILWREKVSSAHLRPSLDNVTEAIKMRAGWLNTKPGNEPDVEVAAPVDDAKDLNDAHSKQATEN